MNKIQFEKLLKPLVEIYDEIELDIIENILQKLNTYQNIQGSIEWYLEKLEELGTIDDELLKIFKKNKNMIKDTLSSIASSSGRNNDNLELLNNYYDKGLIEVDPSNLYKSNSIESLIDNAFKDTQDITELINTKAIEGTKESYKKILNKAYIETASGIYSYEEAIRRALNNFAKQGIQIIHYSNGKSLSIEATVRRDIITRMNKLVGDVELNHATLLNTNLVYVDQHIGARTRTKYTKNDYEAHDEWQGKKYMIVGSNNKYENLYEATGYGEMLGLKGINCYHNMRPTWEWEEIPDRITTKENKEGLELFKKQRYYERNLRILKREKMIAKNIGTKAEFTQAKMRFSKLDQKYNEFLEENNLTRNYNRENVLANITNKIYSYKEIIDYGNENSNNQFINGRYSGKNHDYMYKLLKNHSKEIYAGKINNDEFDKNIKNGNIAIYRNVPKEYAHDFYETDFVGGGALGSGIYTNTDREYCNKYGDYQIKMILDKNSNIATMKEIDIIRSEIKKANQDKDCLIMQNYGLLAFMRGYDAIKMSTGTYLILNKKKVWVVNDEN